CITDPCISGSVKSICASCPQSATFTLTLASMSHMQEKLEKRETKTFIALVCPVDLWYECSVAQNDAGTVNANERFSILDQRMSDSRLVISDERFVMTDSRCAPRRPRKKGGRY